MNTLAKSFWYTAICCFFLTNCLYAQLARQWVSRTTGEDKKGDNVAVAVIADDSGYVYATGWMENKKSGLDFATARYNSDGVQLWLKFYDASSHSDFATAMARDTGGNIYVAGQSQGGATGYDFATIKYDTNGNQVWASRYNGPGNGNDGAVAVAVDDSLNVYVSGWSYGGTTGIDYAVVKYNSSGTQQWVSRHNGPANGTDSLTAMVLDGSSALFVTGVSQDTVNGFATLRYNPGNGDSLWAARYSSSTGPSVPRAMLFRAGTQLYVTGSSVTDSSGSDFMTIRYDAGDGSVDWERRFDGPDHNDDDAYALSVQGGNRLYVTGKSVTNGAFTDVLTLRMNQANGSVNWEAFHNGSANDDDLGVAVTGGNNPLVLASSIGTGTGHDMKLIRYNGSGDEDWSIRYNGPTNDEDVPRAYFENDGGLYVAGLSKKIKGKGTDFVVIKHVDPSNLKYRTITQTDITVKGVRLSASSSVPNYGNIRDEAYDMAFPRIKKGHAGYPGGLVLGQVRKDSSDVFAWLRFTKGKNIIKFLPQTGPSGYFTTYAGKPFTGEKKNPKISRLNSKILGDLVALKINIGASDAEVTPPMFGDVTYDDGDTSNPYNGMTIREIAALTDNYLTYGSRYEPIDWVRLDTVIEKINSAFTGELVWLSKVPFVTTGVLGIDSVEFLDAATAPLLEPLNYLRDAYEPVPVAFELRQNYPNPFNPTTTIEFGLKKDAIVTLTVYDMLGREIGRLLDSEPVDEGVESVEFDGSHLSTGIYFYILSVENEGVRQTRRMILVK